MTLDVGRKIVETVGKSQTLRISESLRDLLYTAVDISEVWLHLFYYLTVEHCLQTSTPWVAGC